MRRHAFTLFELLVVVTIIAILAAMLMPAISLVRHAALELRCASGLRQAAIAGLAYTGDWEGRLAPTRGWAEGGSDIWWHYLLAEYLESDDTIADVQNSRQVLRGCPAWKGSEPWQSTITGYLAAEAYWNCGYGQTNFVTEPDPWPGAGNLNGEYGPVSATLSLVHGASTRPWMADSAGYWLWAPWLGLGGPDDAKIIRSLQRHRGRAVVVYFDAHTGRSSHAELVVDQQQW